MSVGRLYRDGLPFSNVVATGVATAPITPGKTIESIILQLGGTTFTKAMITMIKLKANAKVIFEATGSQLAKILAYRGYSADAAFLEIPFEDLTGTSVLDQIVGSFDTSMGIATITAEVTISGATAPTLAMKLIESAQQKNSAGQAAPFAAIMCKLLRYPFSIANGGRLPITLPFGTQNGAIIKRIHIEHTGNLTGTIVKEDGVELYNMTHAQAIVEQARNKRVPQSNMETIDFVLTGEAVDAFDTRKSRSVELLVDFSAADNGYAMVEYLDYLGNL